jgi:hypothetical protein
MTNARLVLLALGAAAALMAGAWELGRRDGKAEGLAVERAAVVETLAVLDTVYLRDTLRLWRRVAAWDTLWDTLTRHDTVLLRDTAWVRQALQAADGTIRACTATVLTCEQRVALTVRRAELAEEELAIHRRRIPTRREQAMTHGLAAAGGVAFGLLVR